MFQTHHAAFSGLERLSIFSVHRSEAKERKLCILAHDSGLLRAAEYLDKMKFLTLVNHIDHFIRMIKFFSFNQRCKVCGIIKRGTV